MKKGVIFDFDGTLVHSEIDFGRIKKRILKLATDYKFKIPSKSFPVLELIEEIKKINKNKKNLSNFVKKSFEFVEEEEEKSIHKTKPILGMRNLLKKLKNNKMKIGIITRNCKKCVLPLLKKFGFTYDILLTREDVKKVKPHPYHIKKVLKKLKLKPEQAVVVGDHPFDIKLAKKLNMESIAITSSENKKNYIIKEKPDFVADNGNILQYFFGIKPLPEGKLPNTFLNFLLSKYIKNDKSVIVRPKVGMDCAVVKNKKNIIFLKTDPITLVGKDIGFYLVNINVNDIAVMGGIPKWFLVNFVFPYGINLKEIEEIFSQISLECKKFKINWVGGHTEISKKTKKTIASGFIIGIPIKKTYKISKIKKGDILVLIKEIGIEATSILAREKFEVLKKDFSQNFLKKAINSIYTPGISVFKEAILLWKNFNISSMHDPTEGGISTAIYEMAERCNVGFLIYADKLKFYKPVLKLAKYFGISPLNLISSGCILAILPEAEVLKLTNFLKKRKIKYSIIGKVIDKKEGVKFEG